MNTVLRELYMDDNKLENLDFVIHIHELQILTASNYYIKVENNKIKKIPEMP